MAKFTIRTHVEAPPETVFAVASGFHHAAENFEGIKKLEVLTDGPIGIGTRFRETRVMFGKEATEELEIAEFDPPHGYVVECQSCGANYRSEYFFVGDIAGTHVRLEMDCEPVTLTAKLMSPLAKLMMGPMKKCIEADLEDLKRIAEAKEAALTQTET